MRKREKGEFQGEEGRVGEKEKKNSSWRKCGAQGECKFQTGYLLSDLR